MAGNACVHFICHGCDVTTLARGNKHSPASCVHVIFAVTKQAAQLVYGQTDCHLHIEQW